MRAVIQKVAQASVSVSENGTRETVGQIGRGLVVLLGVTHGDGAGDADYIADKVAYMRIFADGDGKMNLAAGDVGGEVLLVSQFTLYGDMRSGRRPSFTEAAPPDVALRLYEEVAEALRKRGLTVHTGKFRSHMNVVLDNDGPVTILLDSRKTF